MTDTTTIKVFNQDRDRLTELFGGPTHEAMRKLLQAACPHPESGRAYTVADVPTGGVSIKLGGFYCPACSRYIFAEAKQ